MSCLYSFVLIIVAFKNIFVVAIIVVVFVALADVYVVVAEKVNLRNYLPLPPCCVQMPASVSQLHRNLTNDPCHLLSQMDRHMDDFHNDCSIS